MQDMKDNKTIRELAKGCKSITAAMVTVKNGP